MKNLLTPCWRRTQFWCVPQASNGSLSLSLRYLDKSDTKGQTLTKHIHTGDDSSTHTLHTYHHLLQGCRPHRLRQKRKPRLIHPKVKIIQYSYGLDNLHEVYCSRYLKKRKGGKKAALGHKSARAHYDFLTRIGPF